MGAITITFTGEVYNELTGHSMELDFDYEVWEDDDITRDEVETLANNYATAADFEVYQHILDNLSIMLNVESIEMEEEDG
jgi:hypothetical protein